MAFYSRGRRPLAEEEKSIDAADKLYATRRPGGKAAAAPAEGEPAAPATAKEPVVKAPARSSESELDIMVEE